MAKADGVARATGRNRQEWFELLDGWGAGAGKYREIADWLVGVHGLSRWWAQKLVVEYEQARGLRPPGVRPDGTFEVTASKTVGVPVKDLFDAFVDEELRASWLPGVALDERTSRPGRSVRFDWENGSSRVNVELFDKGPSKSTVAISHEKLATSGEAERTKAMWRERLAALKSQLEA